MAEKPLAGEPDKHIERWKMNHLIKGLESVRGNGTSMISLVIRPKDQIARVAKMLAIEAGAASNIKSRVNRLSVQSAIRSVQQRLKTYDRIPPNGLVVYCGTFTTEEGKEKKISLALEPLRPINTSQYLCDSKFHTAAVAATATDDKRFGFVVADGNGALFSTLAGNTRDVLQRITVDLPNKHGRGGQSAPRFARLRTEKRHAYVCKVAEAAARWFLTNDQPNVVGLVLAGSADIKTEVGAALDPRLQAIIVKVVDISCGGEDGLNQAIELASGSLANVRLIQEIKILERYFDEISRGTGGACFGVEDTLSALAMGAVDVLIAWEELDIQRVVFKDGTVGHHGPDQIRGMELTNQIPLLEWFVDTYKECGALLEIVSDRSPEGSRFVKGFGGVGALLRYRVDFDWQADLDEPDQPPAP